MKLPIEQINPIPRYTGWYLANRAMLSLPSKVRLHSDEKIGSLNQKKKVYHLVIFVNFAGLISDRGLLAKIFQVQLIVILCAKTVFQVRFMSYTPT